MGAAQMLLQIQGCGRGERALHPESGHSELTSADRYQLQKAGIGFFSF